MNQYGISNVSDLPVFLFFKNGQLVNRIIGTVPRNELFHHVREFAGPEAKWK